MLSLILKTLEGINYFDKSQAVHGFLRVSYGFPQGLGCVEVPIPIAGSSPLVLSSHSA